MIELIGTHAPTPGDDTLTRLSAARSDLEQQRRLRVHQLEQLAATMSSEPSFSAEEPQQEVILELYTAATTVLDNIDAALHRIENGTYGQCQQCQTAIASERLTALPMVRLCIKCQAAEEGRIRRNAVATNDDGWQGGRLGGQS
jgi:RNA polymerase-binding protein DksA